ncbi:MAG: hypothetical protein RLZZ252_1794 [Bacteroidota bacterium]|jgi:uncharacterized membrane protein
MPQNHFSRNNCIAAITVGVVSFIILTLSKNPYPLTSDECFSLYHAQFPIPTIWNELSKGNNPPLFETLLHFWIPYSGNSEGAVRTLPTILISISTALLWLLSRQIHASLIATIFTVLFFLGSNTVLLFAHEIRAYSLLLLFTVLVQLLWIKPLEKKTTIHKILWVVSAAGLIYTHFFGFWILLIQGFFEVSKLIKERDPNKPNIQINHRVILNLFWPWIVLFLLYSPYLRIVIFRFIDSASSGTWMEPAPWAAPYFTLWKFTNIPMAVFPTVLLIILCIKSAQTPPLSTVISISSKNNASVKYFIASFIIPFLGMWLISLPFPWSIPMFNERYVSFVIPSLAIALATPISSIKLTTTSFRKHILAMSLWMILLIGEFSFRYVTVSQNIDVTTAVLEVKKSKNASVVLEPDHAAFQWLYYTNQTKFKQWRSDSIYHHMAQQLIQEKVYILKTQKSLDSFGLKDSPILYYTHLDNRKTDHTQMIEKQLQKKFNIQPYPFSISGNIKPTLKSKTSELWKLYPKR